MNSQNYGFLFNDIKIVHTRKGVIVVKQFKNEHGKNKINNEISFYKYIFDNNIQFSMPKLIESGEGVLSIAYISNSKTLLEYINPSNKQYCITTVHNSLLELHKNTIQVDKEIFYSDLIIEIEDKIINRYNKTNWNNTSILNINTVNGVKINNLPECVSKIKNEILQLVKDKYSVPLYSAIHGDTHLNNIIVDQENNFYFIDPRGYYGNTQVYGLKEYDYAKFLFGLSGYSYFDNLPVSTININNNNFIIDFIDDYIDIFYSRHFDRLTKLLALTIWLGNNSAFSKSEKKITSLMIALYLCKKIL